MPFVVGDLVLRISTHAPAGGATMGELANAYKYLRISTHAPAGGATAAIIDWRYGVTFLLTPLREGRRGSRAGRGRRGSISTHAPAGGATRRLEKLDCREDDFYSRPCGRGDRCCRRRPR